MQSFISNFSPDELGQLLPAYEILGLTTTSDQGDFYEARQRSLSRMVTIKVLPPEISQSDELQLAFATEAKAMARLNHPNLVNVFDFGNIDGTLYLIMENLPKRNLGDITEGHHVDHTEASRLIADICHGLAHAHEQGVIHHNLTPSSILINDEASPKIIDFGISELTGQSPEDAAYRAPENTASAAADIYSIGVMLYRLLTGNFHTDFESYTAPSEITSTDASLDEITAIALQSDPEMRYQKASDMAADLESYIQNHVSPSSHAPELTTTPASPQETLPSATSHGGIGKTALVFILIALGVIGATLMFLKNKEPQTSQSAPENNKSAEVDLKSR